MNITQPNTLIQNADPIRIGFIPLIDCAPFVIAQEKGFLSVKVSMLCFRRKRLGRVFAIKWRSIC